MKSKILILIAFAAIITFSFSFASSKSSNDIPARSTITSSLDNRADEPLGGFITEDKF
jgi:hypothetical protein